MDRFISALLLIAAASLVFPREYTHAHPEVLPGEQDTIRQISKDIQTARSKLTGERIWIFNFTSIKGEDTPDGAHRSSSLL
jgi:hypothetical protein